MNMEVMETKVIHWSPQQRAFLDWCQNGTGSCVLEAGAGTGKSTTLVEGAKVIQGQVALVAYNKKIADELKTKLLSAGLDWKKAQGGTVHSFGLSAYKKTFKDFKVNEYKVDDLFAQMIVTESIDEDHPFITEKSDIIHLVSLAKQRALGVLERIEDDNAWMDIIEHFGILELDDQILRRVPLTDFIDFAKKLLKASNKQTEIIDFDDMIYLPLYLKLKFWQYDIVMVDEAQDTNPARRALVRAMLKKGGRCIAVGDRYQAIYGFTGADSNALDLIAQDFNCIRLPLTVTYRCPKEVVKFSHTWVTILEAHETAPEGKVSSTSMEEFMKRNDLTIGSAVLSRVTKPLVSLAFQMIRKRIPCRVEGRDVANGLKKLIVRWKVKTFEALEDRLDKYLERERTKLLAKKQETKLQLVEDTVETVKIILTQCRSENKYELSDAVAYIDSLFGNDVTDMLVLSTIHKAKGREWNKVFWLDRANTCPSRWARQEWQQEQEKNLCYVAATRAKEELIEIIVPAVAPKYQPPLAA